MKARRRPKGRSRARTPLFVIGAVIGTLPALSAADPSVAARPPYAERRIVIEPKRLAATLGHVRIWAPSETYPALSWQDRAAPIAAQSRAFAIPPGSLESVLRSFELETGIAVTVTEAGIRTLPSPGVSGVRTAEQALTALLAGTGVAYRFTAPGAVTVEIRVSQDAVQVTGSAPRVASPKYAAPLAETPQTIQVIPRSLLDEQGATTLTEALRNVPGITMQAGEGGGASSTSGDMFNMRGFSANNSLFVDGVRDDGLIARDVYNVEQVEVFSGPTGSDVGRTNAAGYINLTTKAPSLQAAQSGTFSYGAADQVRATADLNQPIALGPSGTFLGSAAVRANVLWQDGGTPGRDYAARNSKAIAPSVGFGLDTTTRATLSGQIMRQDNLADYGLPAAASPIGPFQSAAVVAAAPVDQSNYYGSPDADYDHVRQDSVMLRLEHDVRPGLTLRNQARYNTATREAVVTSIANTAAYDPATNLVTLSRQANERQNDIFSNQTSLSGRVSTGRIRHDFNAGLEIANESQFAPTLTGVGTRAPIDLNHPDVFSPVVGMNITPTGALSRGRTRTAAVSLFDAFDLGARLRVNGGIRVERYETSSHAVAAGGVVTDVSGLGTLISGKAGIVLRLTSHGNLYASYGSSLTPPGSANFQLNAAATNQNNPNVDPQESVNYELGTKWDVAQARLQLTGALFRTENTNVIFVVDGTAVPPVFNQDDGQKVKGATLGAVGHLTPWWEINSSLQYLDSQVDSQNVATDGHRLALAPQWSGNLWTTVRLPRAIRLGGGIRSTGLAFISTANTIAIPGYTIADLLAEVPAGPHLTLRLNVYNVTDRVYLRNINNNGGRYNPGTPRSFLLTSAFRF